MIRIVKTPASMAMHFIKACGIKFLACVSLCSLCSLTPVFAQESEQPAAEERAFELRARGTTGEEQVQLVIEGQVVASWQLTRTLANYHASSVLRGSVRIEYLNDTRKRDVRVDYLKIDDQVFQAEDQNTNTGAFQNGKCGGGQGRTEWMRCNGYIEFQTH